MKTLILLLAGVLPLLANHSQGSWVLLDAGATSVTIHNTGSGGTDYTHGVGLLGSGHRWRFIISAIYTIPKSTDTYTPCAAPCTININRNWGQQYYWTQEVDSSGNVISGKPISAASGAFAANYCGGIGTLPQVPFSTITTAPMPMPLEVIGQDCYVTTIQVPLENGHASTGLRYYQRTHNPSYTKNFRGDGKFSIQLNSRTWTVFSNAVATAIDENRWFSYNPLVGNLGGYVRSPNHTVPITDGVIGSGDTTVTIAERFNGTEGNTSGYRVLDFNIIEPAKNCTQIVVLSNVATATCASHGYSNGQTVLIMNAPGMWMRFNGQRVISNVTTDTFDFTPCGTTATSTAACTSPNGTYVVPVNRSGDTTTYLAQPVITVSRCIIPKSAFGIAAMPSAAPGGGDATRGENLWKKGNTAGTAHASAMVNPNFPFIGDTLSVDTTCSSCHFTQGKDMKIFNFSNHSIQRRSEFHGLSTQDGLDIATYIRGLNVPVPINGRPWNPPLQPGPGQDVGTFWKSNSTLTSIVVSSNVATATFSTDPGFVTGDAITVWGDAVDTDLNDDYTITGGSGTTRTFATVNVANGTYNGAGLGLTNTIKFYAGCGLDCQLTYGYADLWEYTPDPTKFVFTSKVDPRTIPIVYQFPDWMQWLPTCMPQDCFPRLDFVNSTAYARLLDVTLNMDRNNYSSGSNSFQAKGYGGLSDFGSQWLQYTLLASGFRNATSANGPVVTYSAQTPHANWPQNSFSILQLTTTKQAEIAIEKQTFQFDGLRQQTAHSTSPTPNPNWSIANGTLVPESPFSTGMHRSGYEIGMYDIQGELPSTCTYHLQSELWYHLQMVLNGGNGYGNGTIIDNAYYNAFNQTTGSECRPNGMVSWLFSPIFTPQVSSLNTNVGFFTSTTNDGIDLTGLLTGQGTVRERKNYWFTTTTDYLNKFVNPYLATLVAFFVNSGRTASYWSTVFSHIPGDDGTCTAVAGWNADGTTCSRFAYIITMFNVWGADATNKAALLAWMKTIAAPGQRWDGHNFDTDVAAAFEADTPNGATGDLSTPQPITGNRVDFTSCPSSVIDASRYYWVTSSGTTAGQSLRGFGPGDCVQGMPGYLTFYNTIAFPGTISVTLGCGATQPPNYKLNQQTAWWKCSNMGN